MSLELAIGLGSLTLAFGGALAAMARYFAGQLTSHVREEERVKARLASVEEKVEHLDTRDGRIYGELKTLRTDIGQIKETLAEMRGQARGK